MAEQSKWFFQHEKGPPGAPQVNIVIGDDGSANVDGQIVEWNALSSKLERMSKMNPVPTVNIVRGGGDCKMLRALTELVTKKIDCGQSVCLMN